LAWNYLWIVLKMLRLTKEEHLELEELLGSLDGFRGAFVAGIPKVFP
jgi:hypothetical protein